MGREGRASGTLPQLAAGCASMAGTDPNDDCCCCSCCSQAGAKAPQRLALHTGAGRSMWVQARSKCLQLQVSATHPSGSHCPCPTPAALGLMRCGDQTGEVGRRGCGCVGCRGGGGGGPSLPIAAQPVVHRVLRIGTVRGVNELCGSVDSGRLGPSKTTHRPRRPRQCSPASQHRGWIAPPPAIAGDGGRVELEPTSPPPPPQRGAAQSSSVPCRQQPMLLLRSPLRCIQKPCRRCGSESWQSSSAQARQLHLPPCLALLSPRPCCSTDCGC